MKARKDLPEVRPTTSELVKETGYKRGAIMRILKDLMLQYRVRRLVDGNTFFWEAGYPIHHSFFGWFMLHMETETESNCAKCIHRRVCDGDMEKRCSNYELGTSAGKGCDGCIHRFTRFDDDKKKIPCFYCEDEDWTSW